MAPIKMLNKKGNWLTGQLFEIIQSKDAMKTYGPIVEYRPLGIFGKHDERSFNIQNIQF
jgi:hypothetical protein